MTRPTFTFTETVVDDDPPEAPLVFSKECFEVLDARGDGEPEIVRLMACSDLIEELKRDEVIALITALTAVLA